MLVAQPRWLTHIAPSERGDAGRAFTLRVIQGPNTGAVVQGCGAEITVGSAPGNHLILNDQMVSRFHLIIRWNDGCYWAVDMESRNGTMVGDRVIRSAILSNGNRIRLGTTTLVFEQQEGPAGDLPSADRWGPLRGSSPAMRRLFTFIPRVARSNASILIEGEPGTGKSVLARAIHDASSRTSGPFLVIDCGAVPARQLEGLLFGHTRAALPSPRGTGAGIFERARGGTVFLEKIDELPLDLQPRIVRAIKLREIRRVGDLDPTPIDLRVLASTHRDLQQMVNRGEYHGPLFDLLRVVTLNMPSLQERRSDIPVLIDHFYGELTGGLEPPEELVCAFAKMQWPGNVRELKQAVERLVLILDPDRRREDPYETEVIDAFGDGTPPPLRGLVPDTTAPASAREDVIERWEEWYIRELLRHTHGDLELAARIAESDRSYLRKLVQRHIPNHEGMMPE